VHILVNNPAEHVFDISDSHFAQAILQRTLYGEFDFRCGKDGLIVNFLGIEPQGAAQPRMVRGHVFVGDDGKVASDDGMHEVSLDMFDDMVRNFHR